jgi:lactoylglutathione lyase
MPNSNNSPYLTDLQLELHVDNFSTAEQFYQLLGFQPVYSEEQYRVISRGRTVINLYGGDERVYSHSFFSQYSPHSPRGLGVEIIIFVDELDAVFDRISKSATVQAPIRLRPWGVRDFRIVDPFGYYLRISEPYNTVERTTPSTALPESKTESKTESQ